MATRIGSGQMLSIWGNADSVNVQKVLWCCEEIGLPYHRTDVGRHVGVVDTQAFRALNPNGLFRGVVRTPEAQRDVRAITAARLASLDALEILDARLAISQYVGADTLTMGDIALVRRAGFARGLPQGSHVAPGMNAFPCGSSPTSLVRDRCTISAPRRK